MEIGYTELCILDGLMLRWLIIMTLGHVSIWYLGILRSSDFLRQFFLLARRTNAFQCHAKSGWTDWRQEKNDNCSTSFASEKFKKHHRQGLNPAFLWFRFPLNQQLGGVQILLPFPFVLIIPNEFPHLQPKLPATMLLSGPWASWRFAKFRQGWVKTLNNWDFEWENLWTYHGD